MVTNINLTSPESTTVKTKLTGKAALFLSIALLAVTVGVYIAVSQVAKHYQRQQTNLAAQIEQEKARISGPEYADLADFQERLVLLDKVMIDHVYFSTYLKNFSKYVLPEVRLTSMSWDSDGNKLSMQGSAPSFDALSRAIILLKNSPAIESIEFKNASEAAASEAGPAGVQFEVGAMVKKEAFNK